MVAGESRKTCFGFTRYEYVNFPAGFTLERWRKRSDVKLAGKEGRTSQSHSNYPHTPRPQRG